MRLKEQHQAAGRAKLAAQALWPDPIVTEISPLSKFYPAEGYHQDYFRNHPLQGYCAFVVAPKVAKFRKVFADKASVVPSAGLTS